MSCVSDDCRQGRENCPTPYLCAMNAPIQREALHRIPTESDEAADKPIAEPWDVWVYAEIAAGLLVLGFVAMLANFFWSNWHVVTAFLNNWRNQQ